METEALHPGSVPVPSETTLWFEYLLDSALLEKKLRRDNSDALAIELMIEFLLNSQNANSNEKSERIVDVENTDPPSSETKSRKNLALKILALKCAAHLKWNFQSLENKVPLTLQQILYQDLLYFVENGKTDVKSHASLNFAEAIPHAVFAISTYHRWVLWAIRSSQIITKPKTVIHIPMPGGQGPTYVPPHVTEGLLHSLELQVNDSVQTLENILTNLGDKQMIMPTMETFMSLTENSNGEIEHHWEKGYSISLPEFELQLRYDLAVWFMFANQYANARKHLTFAAKLFAKGEPLHMEYCTVPAANLKGFLSACQIEDMEVEKSLTERMHESIKNHYIEFVEILQEDNLKRQVPIHYREMAEIDLTAAGSSSEFTVAKDLVFKVQTLNVVRKTLEHRHIPLHYFDRLRLEGITGAQFFASAFENILKGVDASEKKYVQELLVRAVKTNEALQNCLSKSPLKELIQGQSFKAETQHTSLQFRSDFPRTYLPHIDCGELVQQLIESYSISEVHTKLTRLSNGWPNRSLWSLYKKWEIPIPFQSVVMNLPKGFLQDWTYILLAKYRELLSLQDFAGSIEMLRAVDAEVRNRSNQLANLQLGYKLSKLIEWEILLVDIMQFLHHWPKCTNPSVLAEFSAQCRGCLGSLQRGETIFPRSEIVDYCLALLLAAGEWEFLLGLDMRWNLNVNVELASNLGAICYDLQRNRDRPNRKISRSLWDIVIPVFNPALSANNSGSGQGSTAMKRSASGAIQPGGSGPRDSPNANIPLVNRIALSKFCQLLCEPQSLSVMLSLFARLHNVVQDEANLEINSDLSSLWPAVLSNANNYHLPAIGEILTLLLERALSLYPLNTSWLKMQGDLHYAHGFHSAAMSSFLTAASLASDNFNQLIPKQILDETTIRRLIKCSQNAQCYTQAAILCQFLEEIDYATAFRCLQERNCNDAMDSLYSCIWDSTMLEYIIQLHHKRGETLRKTQAMKAIGMLELNCNNNEEIQRESLAQRKALFLRTLTKQYLRN